MNNVLKSSVLSLNYRASWILNVVFVLNLQEMEPKKKASAERNVLASVLKLQRKILRTLNESMDELSRRSKSLWWSRWIPKEE